MGLSQTERTEAQAILNDGTKSETQRTRDFYNYLNSKGENYGRLGLSVTDNNTWQGQIANGFVESGAQDNSGGFEYGSQEWRELNFSLAGRHMQAYDANNGGTPTRQQIQDYHNEEYDNLGLDIDDWFPNRMLNESNDPDALWSDWQTNDSPRDIWEDTIDVVQAGGDLLFGPFLFVKSVLNPDGIDPAQLDFAKNLANALVNMDQQGRDDLLNDLFDNIPSDYGWLWDNPGAILGELSPWLQDAFAPIFGTNGEAPALFGGCPLIIDLGGDGVELISLENSSIHFNFLGNDAAVKMGWVGADDGFLVHDLNGDGQIESVDEMFGSKFGLAYLMTTFFEDIDEHNGFAALSVLDSNGDGVISALDTVWDSLQVWKDANSDGVTDAGELITLDAAGIESIDLAGVVKDTSGNWPAISTTEIEGHWITHSSTVTMSGGATYDIVDAWLNTDLMNAYYAGDYTLDVRTLFLPTLRGYGQLPDLHIAMSLDNGAGGLLEQVQSFATSHTFEEMLGQFDAVRGEVEDILYAWAGIDEAAIRANPDFSQNGLYNLMPEYHFVRTLMGQNTQYVGAWLDFTGWLPQVRDGVSAITEGYQNLVDAFAARLVFQSGGNALFDSGVSYNPFSDTFEGTFALSQAAVDILETEATGHADVLGFWNNAARFIDNTQGIANLSAAEITMLETAVSDSSSGALGWNDVVNTLSLNVMQAGDGGGVFNGTAFDDEITGGDGNDTLIGGDGDDVFLEHSTPGSSNGISDDVYIGGRGNDTYIDGFGNDVFQYDYGDDIISTSESGGGGYHTTTDVIRFGAGIAPEDVSFHLSEVLNNTPNGEFSIIKIAGRGTITIQDISNFPDHYKFIDELHFDDGTIIDFHTFFATYHGDSHDNTRGVSTATRWHTLGDVAVYGYEGDDQIVTASSLGSAYIDAGAGDDGVQTGSGTTTVYLGDGNDRLTGGDGDHIIYDGAGNEDIALGSGDDIYHYSGGDDFIRSGGGGQNTIVLPENITMNDLSFWRYVDPRKGNHQILDAKIDVEGLGAISVWNQFTGHASQIVQTLKFHDGSTVQLADQDFVTIGTDGNDHFSSGSGWPHDDNTYLFGLGNDIIDDPNGTDTLLFGPGITFPDLTIYRATYQGWDPTPSRGSDLFIEDQNGNSVKIVLYDYTGYPTLDYALEHLQFSDGSVVNLFDLEIEVHGSDIAEYLSPVRKDASDDDTFFAYGGDDSLYGGDGNDILHGGAGDDYISGDKGVDESVYQGNYSDFSITSDSNFLYVTDTVGNEGADMLYQVEILRFADGTYDVASGIFSPENLNLEGDEGDNILAGGARDDVLIGHGGDDELYGNDGADELHGGQGNDTLQGGDGDDSYYFTGGNDTIIETGGNDVLYLPEGVGIGHVSFLRYGTALNGMVVHVDDGDGDPNTSLGAITVQNQFLAPADNQVETIRFFPNFDADLTTQRVTTFGSAGADDISGIAFGANPDDTILGFDGADTLDGGAGNDTLFGGTGNDRLIGGLGGDALFGNQDNDTLDGGDGDDFLFGDKDDSAGSELFTGDDILNGGAGADWLEGNKGNDTLNGGNDNDILLGNEDNDTLNGDAGDDFIVGGTGDDTLNGGSGSDDLYGETGADTFLWDSTTFDEIGAVDTVHDFDLTGGDELDVSRLLSGYDPLTDAITDFVHITSDGANSYLRVDTDGGADNFIQIATLTGVTGLSDETALETSGNLITV